MTPTQILEYYNQIHEYVSSFYKVIPFNLYTIYMKLESASLVKIFIVHSC